MGMKKYFHLHNQSDYYRAEPYTETGEVNSKMPSSAGKPSSTLLLPDSTLEMSQGAWQWAAPKPKPITHLWESLSTEAPPCHTKT